MTSYTRLKWQASTPEGKKIEAERNKAVKEKQLELKIKVGLLNNDDRLWLAAYDNKRITIEIDLKRVERYVNYPEFDKIYAAIISHEYIHYLVHREMGVIDSIALDNMYGYLDATSNTGL